MATRLEKAKTIRKEVTKFLTRKGLSCHYEVGLNKWGKLRADILSFNYKDKMIVVEVKSSLADYKTDKKWQDYLKFSTQFYFAFDSDFPLTKEIIKEIKSTGAGILVVDLESNIKLYRSNSTKTIASAKVRQIDEADKFAIIARLAYRAGKLRTNKNTWMK